MQRLRRWYGWFVQRAPRIRDLLYIGFSLITILAQAASGEAGWHSRDWFVLGLGIVASLALWWRRRFPVAVTVVAILASAGWPDLRPDGSGPAHAGDPPPRSGARRYSASRRTPPMSRARLDQPSDLWVLIFTGPFLIGTWVAIGAYIGARRDLMVSLRDRAERAEAERELRADQARLGERARIAQEMHDVLAHKVSLIALHAGGLEVNPAVGPEKVESSAGPDPGDRPAGDGGPA